MLGLHSGVAAEWSREIEIRCGVDARSLGRSRPDRRGRRLDPDRSARWTIAEGACLLWRATGALRDDHSPTPERRCGARLTLRSVSLRGHARGYDSADRWELVVTQSLTRKAISMTSQRRR